MNNKTVGIVNSAKYVNLAREATELFVNERKLLVPDSALLPQFQRKAGVFVSLHLFTGQLRGCVGTFLPTEDNLVQEIIRNSIQAATADPRFHPVTVSELSSLTYSVDILSTPEQIQNLNELNPQKYGLLVKKEHRRGLLLPDLPGINDVQTQFAIACQKGGIQPEEQNILIYRFSVERHGEKQAKHV